MHACMHGDEIIQSNSLEDMKTGVVHSNSWNLLCDKAITDGHSVCFNTRHLCQLLQRNLE